MPGHFPLADDVLALHDAELRARCEARQRDVRREELYLRLPGGDTEARREAVRAERQDDAVVAVLQRRAAGVRDLGEDLGREGLREFPPRRAVGRALARGVEDEIAQIGRAHV